MNIEFFGDVMISRGLTLDKKHEKIFDYLSENVFTANYSFCNLECPILDSDTMKASKFYIQKSNTVFLRNFFGVGLANNHIFDQGIEGLISTMSILERNGIQYSGVGVSKDNAFKPMHVKVNDYNFYIFSLTSVDFFSKSDMQYEKYVAFIEDTDLIHDSIKQYKGPQTKIVFMIHAGTEYVTVPNRFIVNKYQSLISMGVDYIIGGHPHVVQGFNENKEKRIYYSLGDFIFDIDNKYRSISMSVIISIQEKISFYTRFFKKSDDFIPKELNEKLSDAIIRNRNKLLKNRWLFPMLYIWQKSYNQLSHLKRYYKLGGVKAVIIYMRNKLVLVLNKVKRK